MKLHLEKREKTMTYVECVLCNDPIKPNAIGWDGGHNADPLAEGRCCDRCNGDVITARMMEHATRRDEGEDNV